MFLVKEGLTDDAGNQKAAVSVVERGLKWTLTCVKCLGLDFVGKPAIAVGPVSTPVAFAVDPGVAVELADPETVPCRTDDMCRLPSPACRFVSAHSVGFEV